MKGPDRARRPVLLTAVVIILIVVVGSRMFSGSSTPTTSISNSDDESIQHNMEDSQPESEAVVEKKVPEPAGPKFSGEMPTLSNAAFYPDDAPEVIAPHYECTFPRFKRVYDNIPDTELHWTKDHPALSNSAKPCNRK